MLKREGKITDTVIENMNTWHHSGFHVYCGDIIRPDDEEGLEHLAHYVIRAPISQERMLYISASETPSGIAKVIYKGKNSRVREQFTALDWLARLVTHIPNKGEQLVRYYGFYSNKSRGVRKKAEAVNAAAENAENLEISSPVLSLIENNLSRKAFRRNWARLINGSRLVVRSGAWVILLGVRSSFQVILLGVRSSGYAPVIRTCGTHLHTKGLPD
jgi:hypothetical protein